jgi:hypothetical protein|tara:strand:- start:2920 stop:3231 length:312 start_codon:yes stop_codon:yes gene_type:complete
MSIKIINQERKNYIDLCRTVRNELDRIYLSLDSVRSNLSNLGDEKIENIKSATESINDSLLDLSCEIDEVSNTLDTEVVTMETLCEDNSEEDDGNYVSGGLGI